MFNSLFGLTRKQHEVLRISTIILGRFNVEGTSSNAIITTSCYIYSLRMGRKTLIKMALT